MSRSCNETGGVGADGRFVCGTRRSKSKPRSGCPRPSSYRGQQLICECKSKPKQIKVCFQNRRYSDGRFVCGTRRSKSKPRSGCPKPSSSRGQLLSCECKSIDNRDVPYSTLRLSARNQR